MDLGVCWDERHYGHVNSLTPTAHILAQNALADEPGVLCGADHRGIVGLGEKLDAGEAARSEQPFAGEPERPAPESPAPDLRREPDPDPGAGLVPVDRIDADLTATRVLARLHDRQRRSLAVRAVERLAF